MSTYKSDILAYPGLFDLKRNTTRESQIDKDMKSPLLLLIAIKGNDDDGWACKACNFQRVLSWYSLRVITNSERHYYAKSFSKVYLSVNFLFVTLVHLSMVMFIIQTGTTSVWSHHHLKVDALGISLIGYNSPTTQTTTTVSSVNTTKSPFHALARKIKYRFSSGPVDLLSWCQKYFRINLLLHVKSTYVYV